MERPRLYLSRDTVDDWLSALAFGTVDDGQPAENWIGLSEQVGLLTDGPYGPVIGFHVRRFSELDLDDEEHEPLWSGPRFDVPVLGLRDASAAQICLAARAFLDDEPTVNRAFFRHALKVAEDDPEAAAFYWRACLQSGDPMAHYGLGYTLHGLGRYREAYRHLRAYTEIVPTNSWAWCWLGHACASLGEVGEARLSYRRALELEREGAEETNAAEHLAELERA
jgi:tetratricopeptide (TPR) repeat protein